MRIPRSPAATEAPCVKISNRALLPREEVSPEAWLRHHNQAGNEWVTGRSRRALPVGTVALSAVFGKAARRGRRATTDIRASARPGAEAGEAGPAGAPAGAGEATAVGIVRSKSWHE